MKYKIEKNTVQETLVIPLYGRKMCSELYPNLYRDETAIRLMKEIDYDFSVLEKKSGSLMQCFGFLEAAMRQNDLAWEVQAYLKNHPCAAVVNLGCGLDNTGRACDNGRCKIYNLDFPDVIALRQQLLPAGEREQNIPCDLKDPSVSGFFRFLARVGDNGMKMQKTSTSCRPIGTKRSSFLNALYGGESASYASALLASSAAPRIPWSPPQPGAQM